MVFQYVRWLRFLLALVFIRISRGFLKISAWWSQRAVNQAHRTGNEDAYLEILNLALAPYGKQARVFEPAREPGPPRLSVVRGPTQPPADALKN